MPILKSDQKFGEGLDMNRWLVVRKIGEGQFAEVYEVIDLFEKEQQRFAIKLEKRKEKTSVRAEAKVLKRLQDCKGVCRMLGQGTHREHFYIHLELLGLNLAEVRREHGSGFGADGRCSLEVMRRVALGLLEPLEAMHAAGFIHRDVKPANFVTLRGELSCETANFRLVDFGLSRRFVDDSHQPLPERQDAAFRGSTTYASVNAHLNKDLSRRDDLWSWFYILVEMINGTLPWRRDREDGQEVDRDLVLRSKQACVDKPMSLTSAVLLPNELASISSYLASLDFMAAPNYGYIRRCLMGEITQLPAFLAPANGSSGASMAAGSHSKTGNEHGAGSRRADSRPANDDAPAPRRGADRPDGDFLDAPGVDRDREGRDPDRDRDRERHRENIRDGYERERERERDPRDREKDPRKRDSGNVPPFDADRDRERDRDRNRGRVDNRKRDSRGEHRDRDIRDGDRELDHRSDRERRGDHRDYDGPTHRGQDKDPGGSSSSARDIDRGGRDGHHPSSFAKRPRPNDHFDRASPSDKGAADSAGRGTSDKPDRRRGSGSDGGAHSLALAPAPIDRSTMSSSSDHSICHPSRIMEMRDAISIVADGSGPSGSRAAKVAQDLVDLHAGEALGAVGLVIETLLRSTSPADAEVSARWLEVLSCYTGDAASLAWEKRCPRDSGGGPAM